MLVRLLRTTAFRLALTYLIIFSVLAIAALLYVGATTRQVLDDEIDQEIANEIDTLRQLVPDRNLARLAYLVEARSWRPGASLYLITNPVGDPIAGNVDWVDGSLLTGDGGQARVVSYTRMNPTGGVAQERSARVRLYELGQGFTLLVGRDTGERAALQRALENALKLIIVGILVLAVASWLFLGRVILRRVDAVAAASKAIADGDLSQRLPIGTSGDEFDRLSESLNRILERLLALGNSLQDVSENIGHDLRTPLTRMRNRLEGLRLRASDEASSDVDDLINESDQLIRLFDSLLMIARMQAGAAQIERERIDLSEILEDVVDLYEPLAADEGFALQVELARPVIVTGNRELLAQCFANLVDNALKYGARDVDDEASRISISLHHIGDKAVVSIADNGSGIPAKERTRVLDRFVRLEASRGEKPGTGLGLSLVAAVIQVHDGELTLEDAEPGLCVKMVLPASS